MAKTKISEFDIDPANNTDINSINIAEGCAPSGINNAIRQLMSDLKEFQTGAGGDSITAVGVYSDTIGEKTSAAGVTVDGVLLKDNAVTASAGATIQGLTVGKGAGAVSTNTAVGASALAANSTGAGITAIGYQALQSTTGNFNTALGRNAGNATTSGVNNSFVGVNSGYYNTTGSYNTALGAPDSGSIGTFVSNTTGNYNTAIGNGALANNTTGSNNTAIGYQAGYSCTAGSSNIYIGYQAGYTFTGAANGYNVGIGWHALYSATGVENTAIGDGAGQALTTGTYNTFVGAGAGYNITSGGKNSILGGYNGNQGGLDIRTASNYIVLSDGDGNPRGVLNDAGFLKVVANGTKSYGFGIQNHELVQGTTNTDILALTNSHASNPYGQFILFSGSSPNNTTNYFIACQDTTNAKFFVYSNGTVSNRTGTYNTISDQKIKQDIVDAGSQWDDIKAVRFRKYRLIDDVAVNPDAPYLLGVVAQELEQTSPALIDNCEDKDTGEVTKGVKTSVLLMKAAKALQEAMERIEVLEAKVTALENK